MLLLVGCAQSELDSVVDSISQDTIPSNLETQLELYGTFLTKVTVSTRTGTSVESREFSAFLDPVDPDPTHSRLSLQDVSYVHEGLLRATAPNGIPHGDYTLSLLDPRGRLADVAEDLRIHVEEFGPDHISLSSSTYITRGREQQITVAVMSQIEEPYAYPVKVPALFTFSDPNVEIVRNSFGGVASDGEDGQGPMLSGELDTTTNATFTIVTDTEEPLLTVTAESPGLEHQLEDESLQFFVLPSDFSSLRVEFTSKTLDEGEGWQILPAGKYNVKVTAQNEQGLSTTNVNAEFTLRDAMGDVKDQVGMLEDGSWIGTITLKSVTTDYDPNVLVALGPNGTSGLSQYFMVKPGPPKHVRVGLPNESTELIAGETFALEVSATDMYFNEIPAESDWQINAYADVGTLICADYLNEGYAILATGCTLEEASESNFITVEIEIDGEQAQGSSDFFQVLPATLMSLGFRNPPTQLTAGQQETFWIDAQDEYGNLITTPNGTVYVTDMRSDESSEIAEPIPVAINEGSGSVTLALETAVDSTSLRCSGTLEIGDETSIDLEGQSTPFKVVSKTATTFEITLNNTEPIHAGDTVEVDILARDPYDNLDLTYDGAAKNFLLDDSAGSLKPGNVTVSAFSEGVAEAQFTPTLAGTDFYLVGEDDNGAMGTSDKYDVLPGEDQKFVVEGVQPVEWKGQAFTLEVSVRDSYNNRVITYEGEASLKEKTGTIHELGAEAGPCRIGPFIVGRYVGEFVIDTATPTDTIRAMSLDAERRTTDGTAENTITSGSSEPFALYDRDCETAPTVDLTINNYPELDYGVACIPALRGSASVTFDSTAESDLDIIEYVWDFGDDHMSTGNTLTSTEHSYHAEGRFIADLAVVNEDLCAGYVQAPIYIGSGEGGAPVGPIELLADTDALYAGANDGTEIATITLQARDCGGDPASGSNNSVSIGSSLGTVIPPDFKDTSPGVQGTQIKLDKRTGQAEFQLSVADVLEGDEARVVVTYQNDQAVGVHSIRVLNDRKAPYVVYFEPSGFRGEQDKVGQYLEEEVDQIRVYFNEKIRSDNGALDKPLLEVSSDLLGPLSFSRSLESDGRLLVLDLDTPIVWSEEAPDKITVSLPSKKGTYSITDEPEGNRLDGNWNGYTEDEGDPFVFRFGNLYVEEDPNGQNPGNGMNGTLELQTCDVSEAVISPDGQDGIADASEETEFTVSIYASKGLKAFGLELREYFSGETSSFTWHPIAGGYEEVEDVTAVWDGRGLDSQVLANGYYVPFIWLLDMNDNLEPFECAPFGEQEYTVEIRNPVNMGMVL